MLFTCWRTRRPGSRNALVGLSAEHRRLACQDLVDLCHRASSEFKWSSQGRMRSCRSDKLGGRGDDQSSDAGKIFRRCSSQLAGSGRSKLSSIADWPAFPERIASMMSGANNARRGSGCRSSSRCSRRRRSRLPRCGYRHRACRSRMYLDKVSATAGPRKASKALLSLTPTRARAARHHFAPVQAREQFSGREEDCWSELARR